MGARKRMIDPGIWSDEGFLELSDKGRLLFIGLISQADDEGRGTASVKSIKAKIFPADEITAKEIEALIEKVQEYMSVDFYEVNDQRYYQLARWKDHQSIDKPKPSHIPMFQKKEAPKEPAKEPEQPVSPGFESIQRRLAALQDAKTIGGMDEVNGKPGREKNSKRNSARGRQEEAVVVS